jgi:hypothetical protein
MVSTLRRAIAVVTITTALNAIPAGVIAQTAEVKEKPRMYTYDSSWVYPRAKWGEVDKDNAQGNQKILAPALSDWHAAWIRGRREPRSYGGWPYP